MNIPLHSHSGIPGVITFNQQGINLTAYPLFTTGISYIKFP